MTEKYEIFEDECPKCKTKDLDYDAKEVEGTGVTQKVRCNKCGHDFEIWGEISEWVIGK